MNVKILNDDLFAVHPLATSLYTAQAEVQWKVESLLLTVTLSTLVSLRRHLVRSPWISQQAVNAKKVHAWCTERRMDELLTLHYTIYDGQSTTPVEESA